MITATTPELLTFLDKCDKTLQGYTVLAQFCRKYIRIVKVGNGDPPPLPLCFIDKATGEVLLAIKWDQPSFSYYRGNIFDEHNGMGEIEPYGLRKLHNGCPKGFKHTQKYPRKDPSELKVYQPRPKRPHRFERILAHKDPLVTPVDTPAPVPSQAVALGILPARIFTPRG